MIFGAWRLALGIIILRCTHDALCYQKFVLFFYCCVLFHCVYPQFIQVIYGHLGLSQFGTIRSKASVNVLVWSGIRRGEHAHSWHLSAHLPGSGIAGPCGRHTTFSFIQNCKTVSQRGYAIDFIHITAPICSLGKL